MEEMRAYILPLWSHVWVVVPLALAVALGCRCFRFSPATRHGLWLVVLAWFLLPPLLPDPPKQEVMVAAANSAVSAWQGADAAEPGGADAGERRATNQPQQQVVSEPLELVLRDADEADRRIEPEHSPRGTRAALSAGDCSARDKAAQEPLSSGGPLITGIPPLLGLEAASGGRDFSGAGVAQCVPDGAADAGGVCAAAMDCTREVHAPVAHAWQADGGQCEIESGTAIENEHAAEDVAASAMTVERRAGERVVPETAPAMTATSRTGAAANAPGASKHAAASERVTNPERGTARWWEATAATCGAWFAAVGAAWDVVVRLPALPMPLWVGGMLILLLCHLARVAAFRRHIRVGRPAPGWVLREARQVAEQLKLRQLPQIRLVPRRISPLVWCSGRPTLLLPTELWLTLDRPGRRAILCHELAHLRRRDHWVRWVELLVSTVYWWHPVAWWVRKRLAEEADLCCDAWVTHLMPRGRRAYAEALLETRKFVETARVPVAPVYGVGVLSPGARRFARRLTMVMTQPHQPRSSVIGMCSVALLLVGGWLVTPALSCPPDEKEPRSGSEELAAKPTPQSLFASGLTQELFFSPARDVIEESEEPKPQVLIEPPKQRALPGVPRAPRPPQPPTPPQPPAPPQAPEPPAGFSWSQHGGGSGSSLWIQRGGGQGGDGFWTGVDGSSGTLRLGPIPGDMRRVYSLPKTKLGLVWGVMKDPNVPVKVGVENDRLVVITGHREQVAVDRFFDLIRPDMMEYEHEVPAHIRDAFVKLMAHRDVPVVISETRKGIRVRASLRDQRIIADYLRVLQGEKPKHVKSEDLWSYSSGFGNGAALFSAPEGVTELRFRAEGDRAAERLLRERFPRQRDGVDRRDADADELREEEQIRREEMVARELEALEQQRERFEQELERRQEAVQRQIERAMRERERALREVERNLRRELEQALRERERSERRDEKEQRQRSRAEVVERLSMAQAELQVQLAERGMQGQELRVRLDEVQRALQALEEDRSVIERKIVEIEESVEQQQEERGAVERELFEAFRTLRDEMNRIDVALTEHRSHVRSLQSELERNADEVESLEDELRLVRGELEEVSAHMN